MSTYSQPAYPQSHTSAPVISTSASTIEPTLSTNEGNIPTTSDCIDNICTNQLAENFLTRYRINVPQGAIITEQCDGCTISFEVIYNGEAWVSIAFSKDGEMIGSDAVIGIPGENGNVPQKYYLAGKTDSQVQLMPPEQQTLTDASVTMSNGTTIMKFTKIMKESSEIDINVGDNYFLWAYGSSPTLGYHASRGSYTQNLSSGASDETTPPDSAAWLAHGIMAFLAFGVLVPIAVQSSLLRNLLPKGPLWFQLHRSLNATSYALMIALFAVAVAYTGNEGGGHFKGSHQAMGLAMLILVSIQVMGGIFRPPNPDSVQDKSSVRRVWEMGHRITGLALLGCSFWQIGAGIKLYCENYSINDNVQDNYLLVYWLWIGLMSAIIIIGGGYFKIRGKHAVRDELEANASKPALEEADCEVLNHSLTD